MEYIAFHERNDKESNSPFALRGVTKNIICIVRTIMPAYFSITFELNKGRDAIDSFCKTLIHSGLVFKSGYWGFENDGTYSVGQKTERMEQLISVAKKMWVGTDILAVQTGWEDSAIPPSAGEIAKGVTPQAEPFCIINSSSFKKELALTYKYIERNGVLIEDITSWNY